MEQYISKNTIEAIIRKRFDEYSNSILKHYDACTEARASELGKILIILDTIEVIDPYEQSVQYDSIKAGIQAHAETYSFNIESELFNQLTTEEQQALWRKEIEQACVSGGEVGVELARDHRYKENIKVKNVDLIDRKTDWFPSKKQMESLKDMLKYNIGVFDYQKFMEVNSLYDDLTKILDYETDR